MLPVTYTQLQQVDEVYIHWSPPNVSPYLLWTEKKCWFRI